MRKIVLKTCGMGLAALVACGQPDPEMDLEMDGQPLDASLATDIERNLAAFDRDPRSFLATLPVKFGRTNATPFDPTAVSTGAYLEMKNALRRDPDGKTDAWQSHDYARNLVDTFEITRLSDMYRYKRVTLSENPWSDDYWPLYTGTIAKRYADPAIGYGDDWRRNTDQVRRASWHNTDVLSPAEKYDLLVGDANRTMTNRNLDEGRPYYERDGKVETWMGLCHGWAQAAFMLARPQHSVDVLAADGRTRIRFYPSDIKALATLLWANARTQTRFVGGRCNVKNPQTDAIGRIVDPACRDTNAGTWHLSIVNQVARSQRSFILDATYDYEVWNQPVKGYDYLYFNPKTNRTTNLLSEARVPVASFPEDKFKAYRARGTTHIVGIAMNVRWMVETSPSHAPTDGPANDAVSGARYLYTLELDAQGNIIGGEWMHNAHPDFLWVPPAGSQARSYFESSATGTWDGQTPVPATWRSAAARSSAYGQPLAAIVNKLIEMARQ